MSSSHDPRAYLLDIVEDAARVASYITGLDFAGFQANVQVMDAVERRIGRVCEAVAKLGDNAEALMPGHPWAKVRGLGNRLRHAYRTIDSTIIWEVASDDLPKLARSAQLALVADNAD